MARSSASSHSGSEGAALVFESPLSETSSVNASAVDAEILLDSPRFLSTRMVLIGCTTKRCRFILLAKVFCLCQTILSSRSPFLDCFLFFIFTQGNFSCFARFVMTCHTLFHPNWNVVSLF